MQSVYAVGLYSASVEEQECLLAQIQMRLEPKKMANPIIEWHVSRQLVQSASQNTTRRSISEEDLKKRPSLAIPFVRIHLLENVISHE